ncbi:hypothetical protein [Pseudomonas sp. GL-B-12]|uniref:hypothetical protein n=1 Tax=Pseudomonas sp. GL-B-12 TaxID=2832374 RepID=UPI001CBFFB4D|nr:hypothetical protein [Pseudomonas sp. GL-B-12]
MEHCSFFDFEDEDEDKVGGAPKYGDSAFYFSDDAKKYMTMTGGDSLDSESTIEDLAVFGNVYPLISGMSQRLFSRFQVIVEGGVLSMMTTIWKFKRMLERSGLILKKLFFQVGNT